MKSLTLPLTKKDIASLQIGDEVLLSGVIVTARDQAHKRLCDLIAKKKSLPIDLKTTTVYYCGPSPAPKDAVIGACGPTTSSRMDPFTPTLLKKGLKVIIGKGERSEAVVSSIKKNKAVYFATYGGCAAFLQQCVTQSRCIGFKDLGPEALYELTVIDFPVIVSVT